MADAFEILLARMCEAVGVAAGPLRVEGGATLRSALPVSALASASVAATALAARELLLELGAPASAPLLLRPAADAWFGAQLAPIGWVPSPLWDAVSGPYAATDGWIRLHANAPRHRAAALAVLGIGPAADGESAERARARVAAAVVGWRAADLETAISDAGGAAAALRSPEAWAAHPQGLAVAAEPLLAVQPLPGGIEGSRWSPQPARPLHGVRVLDLTRVIAGPTATQLLAMLGAEVLRIDPPDWHEPAVLPLVMQGKRTARLDAGTAEGRVRLAELLARADVLVHGYRAGAIDRLGLDEASRRSIRPGLIELELRAYGFTGPWAGRRGFDSLVQFSAGLAQPAAGSSGEPVALPVQALDFGTGYLLAAAALAALRRRLSGGGGSRIRASLARTALELEQARSAEPDPVGEHAVARLEVETELGRVGLAVPPYVLEGATPQPGALGVPLGRDQPAWLS